ncbi:ABC transporter permease [Frankia sp. CNm7]|uniref:ABC transporter permease n=1 Tax=Frankia nepalensis TaxID=1836974 RepID=A0A937URW8_9ACTN|nr:ABC transporter permease [Frankia nepalensis]MBL7497599.1 ABC transporter permease [Frankia nepalensis]MBL7511785.1 ABC transporter permease [Frankia nepalensis]MBL7523993.1 ABC transporter permease [Frankia nepalensis]MBL7633269.1 ABC transporter permease [Frankia nepalensis]
MRSTTWWLARRLALAVLVVVGAATVAFGALQLVPGDPVHVMMGGAAPSEEVYERTRHELGYDQPLPVRYGEFLGQLLRGDLGQSYQLHQPVADVIGSQLWPTVQLALAAFGLAFVVAAALAVTTAGRRSGWRRVASAAELLMISTPGFWVGVLLLTFFSFRLHLFPVAGGDSLAGLVLPAATLAIGLIGVFAQVMREGLERALEQPFVLSARARGTGETAVRLRHALRHALIPMVTLSGWIVGSLLGGAVLIETIFSREGLGRITATAIAGRDLPLVTGVAVVAATIFALLNIAVDLLYRVIDPRMKEVVR